MEELSLTSIYSDKHTTPGLTSQSSGLLDGQPLVQGWVYDLRVKPESTWIQLHLKPLLLSEPISLLFFFFKLGTLWCFCHLQSKES